MLLSVVFASLLCEPPTFFILLIQICDIFNTTKRVFVLASSILRAIWKLTLYSLSTSFCITMNFTSSSQHLYLRLALIYWLMTMSFFYRNSSHLVSLNIFRFLYYASDSCYDFLIKFRFYLPLLFSTLILKEYSILCWSLNLPASRTFEVMWSTLCKLTPDTCTISSSLSLNSSIVSLLSALLPSNGTFSTTLYISL